MNTLSMPTTYYIQKEQTDEGLVYRLLEEDVKLVASLLHPKKKRPRVGAKTGCLLFFLAFILSDGDVDFADSDGPVGKLQFTAPDEAAGMILKRAFRGVVVRDADGKKVGEHHGAHYFTIGQRKGMNVGGTPLPLFVIATIIYCVYIDKPQCTLQCTKVKSFASVSG